MAPGRAPSEFIERERKKLLELLQLDPDSVIDTLVSRRLISEDEYEILEKISDPVKKTRRLLIIIQRKGELSCQHFLRCLFSTFPEFATTWNLKYEFLKYENSESNQCLKVPIKKNPENPEITVPFSEKEYVDLETSEYFMDNKTSNMETAWLSKEYNSAKITLPHSVENIKYKVPAFIEYLQDGQRYEEPDDSLYLGKEEYLKSLGYSEDLETTVEEENYNNSESIISEEQDDSAYSETSGSSDEGQNEKSENKSLEEEEKSTEERKKVFQDILSCLNMDRNRKLLPDIVKQFSLERGGRWAPNTPGDLVWNFLIKVQELDVTARDPIFRQKILDKDREGDMLNEVENLDIQDLQTIDPLDVLCVSLLCSDSSLQHEVLSNMYQCKFALPLLLPDAENNKSIFMLGALGDIMREKSTQSSEDSIRDSEKFLLLTKMPVISFVRLGYCSISKSTILNTLLSPTELKPPKFFLHRDLPSLMLPRRISDGLVEVVWCIPGRDPLKKNPGFLRNPVAIANLRGDLESLGTQFGFLMEVSSAMFIFTDCLGEKEWNLLMFLENSIERCYFVLGPQARGSEEGQIAQRILKLKSSQLLFWEEETEEAGKNVEGLQAALQEVMSSSLRCVSLQDMALLARELGIQVDQDFDNVPGIQVLPTENLTETIQTEGQPRLSSLKTSSEKPVKEPGVRHEVSPNLHNFHSVDIAHVDNVSPLPTVAGRNLNKFSWKASWVTESHFWSGQRSKWYCPSPFQHKRDHSQGESFGTKYSQPQRFNSHERFLKFVRTVWGHHTNGIHGKSPRPISQHAQAQPEGPLSREPLWRPGSGVSQIGQFHLLGTQPIGAVGKPQPKQACTQGTQLIKRTGKLFTASSFHTYPRLQAEAMHNPIIPASWQEDRPNTQSGSSDIAAQMGSHYISRGNFVSSSQFKSDHNKPSQVKHPQSNASQLSPHPKPFQAKLTQPQSSQTKCSPPRSFQPKPSQPQSFQPKPSQPQSFQSKPSQSQSFQPKPCQPQTFQPKPSQPQTFQPKPQPQFSHSKPSQLQFFTFKTSQPHPSQFKPQTQYFQSKSSQPESSQSKISQLHPSQYKPSQVCSSQYKPQHQSSQYKSSQFHSSQSKPSHSHFSQCKPSQHKSAQPKSVWSSLSQAKGHYTRAGPKRIGKH
ncbi:caspase recruitment domain-containing protein 6 [Sorex fumeus]|uniref:caspase recruitment domain-containing protein 6 n=1 Tax=Sorex fumeus TaxID=62283 RepID=UPI0024AD3781|nr:caspase recruitment domain-containing protein 6 [Sorex fumeus]